MKLGIILLWSGDVDRFIRQVRLAEEVGFDWIGVGDTPSLFYDTFVALSLVARHTARVRLGPLVTSPALRHPVVAAGAQASLEALAPGRTFFGLGGGFSAVLDLGLRPATLATLEAYTTCVRDLLAGRAATWQGARIHLKRASPGVPIYLGAHGPKTLQLAGRLADGVFVHSGLTPELVADAVSLVRAGADEAGRDPAALDLWALAKANVADDHDQAIDEIKTGLAASACHGFGTFEGKRVPPDLIPRIEAMRRRYVASEHQQPGRNPNAALVDELGLGEFLAERFGVVGTPVECRAKVRAIRQAGIPNVVFTGVAPETEHLIRRLGDDVVKPLMADR